MTGRPPLAARLLVRLLVRPRLYEAIAGDLEEDWQQRRRYWRLALLSIADCWRDRLRPHPSNDSQHQGDGAMRSLLQDVRYGGRMMVRNPGFTMAAVLTLALGIGANSAIFSLINILALEPLSYREPSQVAFVMGIDTRDGDQTMSISLADYLDVQRLTSVEQAAAYSYVSANLTGGDLPERVQAYRVTANTFDMLGVPPAFGRTFAADDAGPGRDGVAVISHGLWQRRFGADPSVIGRQVILNGRPHEIIGVMPRQFEYPVFNFKGDLWIPWALDLSGAALANRGTSGTATVIARIRNDVPEAQAQAELDTLMTRLATEHPATNGTLSARFIEMGRLDDEMAGAGMVIVSVTVSLVLLLACANVANLLLARGVSRSRELAVRAAVGASRWRIARQLLVESLLLALAGAAAGLLLARLALDAIRSVLPEIILTTMPNIMELGIDGRTLAFTLAVTAVTSLVFGLLPALRAARPRFGDGLKEGTSGGGSRGTRRLRTSLVVAEVALATLLLITAGLLARSYAGLRQVDPGFTPDHVLTMAMTLPADRYPDPARRRGFYAAALERITSLPGVRSAAFVNVLPFSTYNRGISFTIDGSPVRPPGQEPNTSLRVASAGYFSTMEIPVREGRTFASSDVSDGQPVAIVNETFAKRHFAGASPIGRRIRFGDAGATGRWITLVGVIGDVRHGQVTEVADPELYVPLTQADGTTMMMLAVRTEGRPEDAVASVRSSILAVDPQQPVYHVKSMGQLLGDSLLPATTSAALMTVFSGVALLLSIIGVYGVVSYGVTQQMPEFGLRLALGATPRDLMRLVLRRGSLMIAAGAAIGAGAALAAGGALGSLLYGVTATDPLTYAAAIAALLTLGIAACTIPAWRAASVEPLSALRSD